MIMRVATVSCSVKESEMEILREWKLFEAFDRENPWDNSSLGLGRYCEVVSIKRGIGK